MPRAERNRHLFASAITGSTSGSTTSRCTRAGTDLTTHEKDDRATTRTETSNSSNYILFIDILILLLKLIFAILKFLRRFYGSIGSII